MFKKKFREKIITQLTCMTKIYVIKNSYTCHLCLTQDYAIKDQSLLIRISNFFLVHKLIKGRSNYTGKKAVVGLVTGYVC